MVLCDDGSAGNDMSPAITSQTYVISSYELETTRAPSGEKVIHSTERPCPAKDPTMAPVDESNKRIIPFFKPETILDPSGENASDVIGLKHNPDDCTTVMSPLFIL